MADPAPAGCRISGGPWPVSCALLEWQDSRRGRQLPLRVYLPADRDSGPPLPMVVFSHGVGGSRFSGEVWLRHWASWGIVGIAVQHPGSDDRIFTDRPPMAVRSILRNTMTPDQLADRAGDLRFVIDQLTTGAIAGADPARIGIAGHSFGAVTVQALSGERLAGRGTRLCDPRPLASLALSPSARGNPVDLDVRFRDVHRPFFSITGSRDGGIGPSDIAPENRHLPFRHMPGPDKYLLLIEGAGHLDFSGHATAAENRVFRETARSKRDFTPLIKAASTIFWEHHLNTTGESPVSLAQAIAPLLDPGDRFEVGAAGTPARRSRAGHHTG